MTWASHFVMNQSTKEFGFAFVNEELSIKYYKYNYDDLIGITVRENITYETEGTITGDSYNINDSNSFQNGDFNSETERVFNYGTIILKLKKEQNPLFKLTITDEEDYDTIKSFLEIIVNANDSK